MATDATEGRMTVDDITAELPKEVAAWTRRWLEEHHCAGLSNDEFPCSCPIDDLFACGSYGPECYADREGKYLDQMF